MQLTSSAALEGFVLIDHRDHIQNVTPSLQKCLHGPFKVWERSSGHAETGGKWKWERAQEETACALHHSCLEQKEIQWSKSACDGELVASEMLSWEVNRERKLWKEIWDLVGGRFIFEGFCNKKKPCEIIKLEKSPNPHPLLLIITHYNCKSLFDILIFCHFNVKRGEIIQARKWISTYCTKLLICH